MAVVAEAVVVVAVAVESGDGDVTRRMAGAAAHNVVDSVRAQMSKHTH